MIVSHKDKKTPAYIPSNALHQFVNMGEEVLELICIVPEEGESEIKRR
ncbi:mannose-6-phosphate isomerase-like protein (cupin superfamily) [Caldanaerobacter subterraneus subsp. tengcongensis MB4]|jgi:mannose-6-phosphate isomerase-like protein (cupin superfamily)|nr:hypothetical protein [Caldanaerobacter subterraneus]MBE3591336.1 hypothetical protein [Thermoanaerobacter sp.]MCS3917034.1 mannose-6-phosphate isomerase-like protein (cupin superfamily) [Caldanaerobacter subterraneus subsp. tengcongensis MB4]